MHQKLKGSYSFAALPPARSRFHSCVEAKSRPFQSVRLTITVLMLLTACFSQAETPVVRLATWNLEHLAEDGGDGCRPRSDADYARLRKHAARLNADLIALQEVENEAAVARLFDPDSYAIEVARGPDRDLGVCRQRSGQCRTMQRTGFVINKARLAELGLSYRRLPDFRALGMESQRQATWIRLESVRGSGKPVHLLSLHLKSGCAWGRLEGRIKRPQCKLLVRQRGILEEWIDARASAGERFVLLGDFNRQLDQPRDHFWADIDDGAVCTWIPDPVLGRRCRQGSERPDPNADLVLANAGRPFPYPFNPRYPYAIDHIVLDPVTAGKMVPESYLVLDYRGDGPPPSDLHPITISLRWAQH